MAIGMTDKEQILNLLKTFSTENSGFSWSLHCRFSDGLATTINEIRILAAPDMRAVGILTYQVETGKVFFCNFKGHSLPPSQDIIELLEEIIYYSRGYSLN